MNILENYDTKHYNEVVSLIEVQAVYLSNRKKLFRVIICKNININGFLPAYPMFRNLYRQTFKIAATQTLFQDLIYF